MSDNPQEQLQALREHWDARFAIGGQPWETGTQAERWYGYLQPGTDWILVNRAGITDPEKYRTDDREPLLWLADAAAWRTRRALVDHDAHAFRRLAPVTDLHEADVLPIRLRGEGQVHQRTRLQDHLNLFRARAISSHAADEADRAFQSNDPDANVYDLRENNALRRVDAMREHLRDRLARGTTQPVEHYFDDPPNVAEDAPRRGLT